MPGLDVPPDKRVVLKELVALHEHLLADGRVAINSLADRSHPNAGSGGRTAVLLWLPVDGDQLTLRKHGPLHVVDKLEFLGARRLEALGQMPKLDRALVEDRNRPRGGRDVRRER